MSNSIKSLVGAHLVGHTPTRSIAIANTFVLLVCTCVEFKYTTSRCTPTRLIGTARYNMHYFLVAHAADSALQHLFAVLCLVGESECANLRAGVSTVTVEQDEIETSRKSCIIKGLAVAAN